MTSRERDGTGRLRKAEEAVKEAGRASRSRSPVVGVLPGRADTGRVDVMGLPEVSPSLRSWMSVVSEIVRAVNDAEPLPDVLTHLAVRACELIGFEFCAVMLADERRERLRVVGCSGLTPDYLAELHAGQWLQIRPPGHELDTPAARAYREGRTIVVPDVRAASCYGKLRHLAPTQGYRALLASPLRGSGDLAGVFVAYSVAARQFGRPELELVELLSGQAATALETARLRTRQQDVIRELSRANDELRRERAVLEWAEQQHHNLMRLVLDEVDLHGLVGALAASLRASVTVEDADGRILAWAPERGYRPPPGAAARRHCAARTALGTDGPTGRRYAVIRVPVAAGTDHAAAAHGSAAWAAPVVIGGELAGRLWVTDPPVDPEPVQLRVIERFALVVALVLLQQRHLLDVQSRLSGDLLGDLLQDGDPDRRHFVLSRAAALGHDLSRPHIVALVAVDGPVPATVRLPELVRAAAEPGPRPLVGPYDGLQVVLIQAEPEPRHALRRMLGRVEQAVRGRAVATVVVGPSAREPGDYASAFGIARGALALRRAGGHGGLVDVGDLGLAALLLETGATGTLRRRAANLLRPVEAHERRYGGELLATLRRWLAAGCSTAATAEALVVHRNTVTYRLERVEQLVGRSLRDSGVRLELQLALTVRDIVGVDPTC